jgi:trigger factor
LKITKEDTANLEVTLNVELETADMEPFIDRSYRSIANRIQVPGFRRGKAPRYMVENYVGREALVRENIDAMLQESLGKVIDEEELEAFGDPDVDLIGIDPVSFKAVVPLEPRVELGDFRSLRLEPDPIEITDENVEEVLESLQYEQAPWQPSESPIKFGDLVTLDMDGWIDGERAADEQGVDFIPAQDNPLPLPGFSIHLEGMNKDNTKDFTLPVPEDFHDTTIAGKECRFTVNIREVKEKALPEIDDEFAKGIGDGFESLEALRVNIMENLTTQAERATQSALRERSLEEVIKGASIEIADLTANREVDHLLEEQAQAIQSGRVDMETYIQTAGKSLEELQQELRPTAEERLARFLVLRKLAREEGLEVSDEEVDQEIDNMVSMGGDSGGEALRRAFSSGAARGSISSTLLNRKVLDRLAEIVQADAGEQETPTDTLEETMEAEVSADDESAGISEQEAEEQASQEVEQPADQQPDQQNEAGRPQ